jgi:hypothetical protein
VSGFVDALGRGIGEFVRNVVDAGAHVVATVVQTSDAIVPGGFPVFVVLCVIAVLVGLATLRR